MNTLKMVRIPGGTYTMGCSPNDNDCFPDECSRHTITISNFQISAYEITQAQWVAVMGITQAVSRRALNAR
jgi:formylglycine-generating enzyme required for sulfatase activity